MPAGVNNRYGFKSFTFATHARTSGMIADQLKTQLDVTLDKRKIHLEQPIRTLGEHQVLLRLHRDVSIPIKVVVEPEQ